MIARVLNVYIGRRFTATLALILFAVGLTIMIVSYVDVLRSLSDEDDFNAVLGLRLALMHVPLLLDTALPFVFLFGALLGLLGLSRKLELVVARASGVSVWGFLKAPALVALLFGALTMGFVNPIAIRLEEKAANTEARISGKVVRGNGHWFRQTMGDAQSIVYAASADPGDLALYGITAFIYGPGGRFKEKVTAPSGVFDRDRWILTDATAVSASNPPHAVARYELATDLSAAELKRSFVEPETISVWRLPNFISTAERMGLNPNEFRVEFHTLVSRPVFLLAMVIIAATVSLRLSRYGGTWRLVLTGAAIGFLLYALSEIAGDLGSNGLISPVLAAWLPPIAALTFGATALLFQEDG